MRAPTVAIVLVAAFILSFGCGGDDTPDVAIEEIASGLLNPVGLALLPDGSLLVAEEGTGDDDTSAGVSLVTDAGAIRIVSGLPSGRDSGDLSGVPLVGVAPDGSTIYTSHFGLGGLYRFALPGSKAVDDGAVLGADDLELTMTALNRVQLVNAFDIAFDADGRPVVTDASENGVATITDDGATEFIHRFGELRDPGDDSLRIDPVPTGISRWGDEYFVTLTGGCPYPAGSGRVVAIDGNRGERVVIDGLHMPIDVAHDTEGNLWVLEFARFDPEASCFTGEGYRMSTGRLSKVVGDELETVANGLDLPTSMALAPDGTILVSELGAGRVIRIGTPATTTAPPVATGGEWRLRDVAAGVGVDFVHSALAGGDFDDRAAQMGGGVCWLDVDADGWLDLFLVDFEGPSTLYRNTGGRFTGVDEPQLDVRGMGCVAADFDGDGRVDLVVTADGVDTVLLNRGGEFERRQLGEDEWTTAAAAADVDGDGDLDLFVGAYLDLEVTVDKPSGAYPQDHPGLVNHLYVNDGAGNFTDVAGEVGLGDARRTLGAVFSDADGDGDVDLYVANDGETNRLYLLESATGAHGFRFVDSTDRSGTDDSGSGMGIAPGDFDNDGHGDLMITNWDRELHALYRGGPAAEFIYSTFRIGYAGFGAGQTGWGVSWADLDHDSDLDLLIANGRVPVVDPDVDAEPLELFANLTAQGEPGQLRSAGEMAGLDLIGPLLARGSALADFDNDGDLDAAVNVLGGPAVLLRNDSPPGSWLTLVIEPAHPGTVVEITLPNGDRLRREILAGSSYLSSEDPRVHVGLGSHDMAERVTVTWPDRTRIVLDDLAANTRHTVEKPGD